MPAAIQTKDLCKLYQRGAPAVSGLDLAIPEGSVYGLMGRNGAGKTTALRLLMGLLRADRGEALVLGNDLWRASAEVRSRVAYVPQKQSFPNWMSLGDLERYAGVLYRGWDGSLARRFASAWELAWTRPVGRFSGGEQKKVSVLLALAARPEVLLLDEPAAGLDPVGKQQVLRGIVEAVGRVEGCTVLLCTHQISDLERLADHIGIMDRGRLVASCRLEEMLTQTRRVQVVFEGKAPPAGFIVPGAVRSLERGPVVTAVVRWTGERQLAEVRQIPGARVQVFSMGLEEIFLEVFSGDATNPDAWKDRLGGVDFFAN